MGIDNSKKEIKTLEDFIEEIPIGNPNLEITEKRYKNFDGFWRKSGKKSDLTQDTMIKSPYLKRFKEERPFLNEILTYALEKNPDSDNTKPFEPKLFDAYKEMKSYGATDSELNINFPYKKD